MGKRTVILIPCYNESKTIEDVIADFKKEMPHADIFVYDNNSDDHSDELAKNAGAIVCYEYKQGKGNVVRSMFRDIEADCYIMADGDDTYPASFAKDMEQIILSGKADMVVGDRLSSTYFTENKRAFHNFGNVLVRKLINVLFRSNMHDIMTGARAFNYDFVKTFPVLSKGFEIETEMTIFALDNNFKIIEIPIEYRDRPEGSESKLNTYSDGFRVLKTIATLLRDCRPFFFFTTISFVVLLFDGFLFLPILIDFLKSGAVMKFPTLIVLSGIAVIGVLNFFCGVILTVLKKQHRQMLEWTLTLNRKRK